VIAATAVGAGRIVVSAAAGCFDGLPDVVVRSV